jgi:hypothetical protein
MGYSDCNNNIKGLINNFFDYHETSNFKIYKNIIQYASDILYLSSWKQD